MGRGLRLWRLGLALRPTLRPGLVTEKAEKTENAEKLDGNAEKVNLAPDKKQKNRKCVAGVGLRPQRPHFLFFCFLSQARLIFSAFPLSFSAFSGMLKFSGLFLSFATSLSNHSSCFFGSSMRSKFSGKSFSYCIDYFDSSCIFGLNFFMSSASKFLYSYLQKWVMGHRQHCGFFFLQIVYPKPTSKGFTSFHNGFGSHYSR